MYIRAEGQYAVVRKLLTMHFCPLYTVYGSPLVMCNNWYEGDKDVEGDNDVTNELKLISGLWLW